MKLNSIFSFLIPKESSFFESFKKQGDLLAEASKAFVDFIKATDMEERRLIYKTIKNSETTCDGITNELFDALNDTFVTPFDREDIRLLADSMDDVIDYINSAAKRIVLYQPESIPPQAVELVQTIKKGCDEIQLVMNDFKQLKTKGYSVSQRCGTMKHLERHADDVYEHFMIDLFQSEKDPIELFKMTQITKELERATNCVNAVGKVVKTILVKYY